ncbi:sporulation integral membrane protein YtvI [Tyzzerella sp. OttesenSCG-928-J15]|nr:sporulation integral membrane protein YtvI [Tyzzerella sp. OttesenSCG-928-J15]
MDNKTNARLSFIINLIYYALVGVIVYLLVKYVASWLMPFIIAFCIVGIMHPLIKKITNILHIKHEIVAVTAMVLVYALLGYGITVLVINIAGALVSWFSMLPSYYESTLAPTLYNVGNIISQTLRDIPFLDTLDFSSISSNIMSALQSFILSFSQSGISMLASLSSKVPNFFVALIFTIMLSLFISTQYTKVTGFLKSQIPEKWLGIFSDLKKIFKETVIKYVKAILRLMCITFIELCIGFMILKIGNPLAMAAGIALVDALPVFGTGAVMIPWILIELIQSNFSLALGLLILYGIITLVRNVIEPKIVGDQLGLNPVVSLIVIYIGFRVFGVFGMIFMPIVAQVLLALHENGNIKLFKETPDNNAQGRNL